MDLSRFPLQTHTEVSQCPDPDLHRCGGRTRTIPADPVVICQYLRVAQKCVSAGSHQLSALHVSQSAMEEKACFWQGLFSLFCLHTQLLGTHQTIAAVWQSHHDCHGSSGAPGSNGWCTSWCACWPWLPPDYIFAFISSCLSLPAGPEPPPPLGTTTSRERLKVTFSFAALFLMQIRSPIQVTT